MSRGGGKDNPRGGPGGLGRQDSMSAALRERDPEEDSVRDYPKEYGNTG